KAGGLHTIRQALTLNGKFMTIVLESTSLIFHLGRGDCPARIHTSWESSQCLYFVISLIWSRVHVLIPLCAHRASCRRPIHSKATPHPTVAKTARRANRTRKSHRHRPRR